LAATLCSRNAAGVELTSDLAQGLAGGVRSLDSFDNLLGELLRAASERGCRARRGGSPAFGEESFELVGGDQPCAPGHLDRLDAGRTRRMKVERLTPRASAAWLRV
jgi:hypothetical protein